MDLPYVIVDVFAERPLEGNQLAVVFSPAELISELRQSIAREMNFSETTFVTGPIGEEQVRIHTTARELPFAGHPMLGTASVLRNRRGSPGTRPDEVIVNLPTRSVTVRFDAQGMPWFESPPARQIGECRPEDLVSRLGLTTDQLSFEPITVWDVGPRFVIVELADLPALQAMRVDQPTLGWIAQQFGDPISLYAFTTDAYGPDAHYAARMLFSSEGLREDPATGSANACFATYLRGSNRDPGDVVIVEQGFEVGRPSRIYLRLDDPPLVGGHVHQIAEGVLHLP